VARLAPRPDVAASVRKLPGPILATSSGFGGIGASALESGPALGTSSFQGSVRSTMAIPPRATLVLAPDRYRLQVTIGLGTLQKLNLAKDMLRHAIPSGDEAAILDRALTLLLEDVAKKKFAATPNPRPAPGSDPASRHIPAEVRRAVWLRDLGRCAYVAPNGRRCTEHGFLEFHHVKPFAAGGEATLSNIHLRCRKHNQYEARVFFARGDGGELVPERVQPRPTLSASGGPGTPAGTG